MLSQSLNHFRDANPKIHKWYDKLMNNSSKRVGIVRMAICRRVFTELYQMLKKGEYHWYRDEKNHTWKMVQYRSFLRKARGKVKKRRGCLDTTQRLKIEYSESS
jgi:transposase